jgi:hypothetical protein
MPDINWTISTPGKPTVRTGPDTSKEKIPHIARMNVNDKMTELQKVTVTNYNLMQETLIKNELMEKK